MKSKNIIKKLLNECSFEITDSFLKSNKETLEKANITERDFINLYNESNLSWNIDHIDKLNIEMYSSMQTMDFRIPWCLDSILKFSFRPNRDWCEKIANAICRLGYPYFGHCLICGPYDGHWVNNIPYLLVADKHLVVELRRITYTPHLEYCNNGYFSCSEGRFSGFIPYLYKEGHIDLFERVMRFIIGEYITCGEHMAFLTVNLLNFLRVNNIDYWYKKVYNKFGEIKTHFDGVDWNNKLHYLSGISRRTLKSETKDLTIEEALKI